MEKLDYATPISDHAMLESLLQMVLAATHANQAIILLIEERPAGRFGAISHNLATEQDLAEYLWHMLEQLDKAGIRPQCWGTDAPILRDRIKPS